MSGPAAAPAPAGASTAGKLPRVIAEATGTALLVAAIVGSGVAASRLSPDEPGLQLAHHAAATAVALAVLIAVFAPVSGAHFNPAVTLVEWLRTRRHPGAAATATAYLAAQLTGAAAGAVLANLMFELPAVAIAVTERTGTGVWLGELVATAGLVLVIGALSRAGRSQWIPLAVGGWIGAAIWFTASHAFANPAVTVGRMLTDSYTGIGPLSVPGFVAGQLIGAALGAGLVSLLWPTSRPGWLIRVRARGSTGAQRHRLVRSHTTEE